jgi:hypothetical protein
MNAINNVHGAVFASVVFVRDTPNPSEPGRPEQDTGRGKKKAASSVAAGWLFGVRGRTTTGEEEITA